MLFASMPVLNWDFVSLALLFREPDHLYCRPSHVDYVYCMRKFGLIAAIVGFGILGADLLLRLLTNSSSWLWLPGSIAFAGGAAALLWSRWSSESAVVPAPQASPGVGPDPARLLDNFEQRFAELKRRKPSGTVLGDLYTLGTQLESRGRATQATAVFRHLARIDNTYKDVSTRLKRLMDTERAKPKTASSPTPAPAPSLAPTQPLAPVGPS